MRTKRTLILLAALVSVTAGSGCTKKKKEVKKPAVATKPVKPAIYISTPAPMVMPAWDASKAVTGPEGLQWIILHEGSGSRPAAGKTVSVHYAGWLLNGKKFDASVDRHKAFDFVLGRGQVIRGWDLTVSDMLPGEHRRVKIPPHIAYGTKGAGAGIIPPNATLVFDIQLLSVR